MKTPGESVALDNQGTHGMLIIAGLTTLREDGQQQPDNHYQP